MSPTEGSDQVYFDGSNWENFARLATQATLARIVESDVTDDRDQSAWFAQRCRGPALDWVGNRLAANHDLFDNYDNFLDEFRNAFGLSDDGLRARRRGDLDALKWQSNLPVFFAEFDRLCSLLSINGDATRIAMVRTKLPIKVQSLLAEQALDFANYDTMRERLLTMWALDPGRKTAVTSSSQPKKPRCGRCGKKGHSAADCRDAKN